MSKNTMIYGLLIAGGLLAYFAWKKKSATTNTDLNSSTTGTFVDDVPVSQAIADSLDNTGGIKPVKSIKDKISQIVEPLIGSQVQTETNNVRPYQGFEEITYES
jgi:pSer/pThr/pTyr-binding forkhead associated (FHA) protein